MARVTPDEVKKIIELDSTITDPCIEAFINTANLVITDRLTGSGLSVAMLKEIEKWTAAHFLSVRDPRAIEEEVGDSRVRYNLPNMGNTLGFHTTMYGRTALTLDSTGILADTGKRRAEVKVIA